MRLNWDKFLPVDWICIILVFERMIQMIQTVIFDIDDTLYSYTKGHKAALPLIARYAQEEMKVDGEEFIRRYNHMMDKQRQRSGETAAMHNRYLRFQMLLEEYGLPLTHVLPLNDLYWTTLLNNAPATPGIYGVVDQLRAKDIRIGIGTDMTVDWQLEKLKKLGLLDKMDFIVSSEEAGAEKPDAQFFDLCLYKASCPRENCLFVGDNLNKDALGAQKYGMHGVWYQPDTDKAEAHPEVRSIQRMEELFSLLSGA